MQPRQGTSKQSVGKLAVIAPREDQPIASAETTPSTPLSDLPKTRLPPRSRSGCWTCRTRKVKCDENKPRCNQCSRLGHRCDYSPKLAFKDETSKIIEKYLGPGGTPDWIRELSDNASDYKSNGTTAATPTTNEPPNGESDHLPPFASLQSEEEWQKKASSSQPGTYFIVTNAFSFEHTEGDDSSSSAETRVSSQQNETEQHHANIVVDPNTIILGSFEEMSQQINSLQLTFSAGQGSEASNPTAGTMAHGGPGPTLLSNAGPERVQLVRKDSSISDGRLSQPDPWIHYRSAVRRFLLPVSGIHLDALVQFEDAFEHVAKRFAPLEQALMAITALSLSQTDSSQAVNALQHYDSAIGPLRHEQDLASDGAFLTHFVLLLYELAGNESFWAYHMASLKSVIQIRRQTLSHEPYPYVIWCACLIDINASLSGMGQGDFTSALVQGGMVPSADEMLQAPPFLANIPVFDDNSATFRAAWNLHRDIYLIAAEIAQNRTRMQAESAQSMGPNDPFISPDRSQATTGKLQKMLDETWNHYMDPTLLRAIDEHSLTRCTLTILNAARVMYYSSIIFLYRHMSPSPLYSQHAADDESIRDAARSVVRIAHEIVQQEHFDQRFIVFPLLLSGTVLGREELAHVQQLMQRLAVESLGSNTRASLRLLQLIHERQAQLSQSRTHQPLDLFAFIENSGIQVVHFGL